MTDKETKMALECCGNLDVNGCHCCPLHEMKSPECLSKLCTESVDLINRQQGKIDYQKAEINLLKDEKTEMSVEIIRQQAEIERLTINMNAFGLGMKREKERADTIRAEAIKEFADEIDYEVLHKEFWNDHPHTSQVWLNGYEQCMRDMRIMLKDKLKEMVGEDK